MNLQRNLILGTLLVFQLLLLVSSHSTTFYVVPSSSSCPPTVPTRYCNTLNYFAQMSMFRSNTSFHFLDGIHELSYEIIVSEANGLSLIGLYNSTVLCSNHSAGFAFFNTADLRVLKLDIVACSIRRNDYHPVAGAIIARNVYNTTIESIRVMNASGYGLAVIKSYGYLTIENSVFMFNVFDTQFYGGSAYFSFVTCEQNVPRFISIINCQFLYSNQTYRDFTDVGTGGLTFDIACFNVHVYIEHVNASYNYGYFGANIFIQFRVFTNNSVVMKNVTSSNGQSDSRGAGLFINIPENIALSDEYSCQRTKHAVKENMLLDITALYILSNTGLGALLLEDRSYPGTDCVAQFVEIKDSVFADNVINTLLNEWPGTAVRFAFVPTSNTYKHFNILFVGFINCTFERNRADKLLYREQPSSALYFEMVKNVTIKDCHIRDHNTTGIQAFSSNVYFQGHTKISRNSAFYGGGLLLLENSFMFLASQSQVDFIGNHADTVGGGILSDFDLQVPRVSPCFFQLDWNEPRYSSDQTVNFHNNTAGFAGSAIFGGRIGCLYYWLANVGYDFFTAIFKARNTINDPSAVTSDPYYACFCFNNSVLPNCSVEVYNVSVYPGDYFQISIATVGGYHSGTIPGVVHSKFTSKHSSASFGHLQAAQDSKSGFCTKLNYSIFSTDKVVEFYISAEKVSYFPSTDKSKHFVIVTLLDCPPGFKLSNSSEKCDCEKSLKNRNIQCFITSQTFMPPLGSWLGYYNSSTDGNISQGTLFHQYCPNHNCIADQLYISLNNTDMQCVNNRSGILCGQCQPELSLSLGTENCLKCSNNLISLIVVFIAAGLLLVLFLFVLRLTVSEGSINGLIFYANVIKLQQTFLSVDSDRRDFLRVFIAWLNLDFGIQSCFYDGMDSFAKTLLQFVFPLYIWFLVISLIVAANRVQFIANIIGERAVQVLSTLLLLSYSKLQHVVVTIVTYTTLEFPDGSVHYVWLYDGNVGYLEGRHIILFVIAVLFFALFIFPYTVLLTFFKLFQAHSNKTVMSWINKLKPVIDAYAGPYKDNFRFWTGFLLLSRTVLTLALLFNSTTSPDFSLFAVTLVAVILSMILGFSGGIYKDWLYNIFESLAYFNITCLSLILMYSKTNHFIASVCSKSLALIMFLVAVSLHAFKYTCLKSCLKKCSKRKEVDLNENDDLLLDLSREDFNAVEDNHDSLLGNSDDFQETP